MELECNTCGGNGCADCQDSGKVEIAECPYKIVDSDTWEAITCAGEYAVGHAPVIGGVLDQSKGFIDAARFIRTEENYWKAKLRIDG